MPSEKELKVIRKIQDLQTSMEAGMDKALPKVFSELSNKVIDITNQLSLDPKDRVKTLREMIKLKQEIADTIVNNPTYQKEVAKITDGFNELADLSNEYIGLILDSPFVPKKALYEALLAANIDVTTSNLLGAGIRDNFGNAITEVLKANVSGVGSRTELQKTLAKFIKGTPEELPFLQRYIKQATNDAVMGFNREYIQTISDDLGFNYYRYQGTVIEDSRPFCKARTGRVYTKEEVQKWASLGNWDGRMAGTNSVTIFTNAGGYNCRHTIFPITDAAYEVAKKEGRAGMR
jgi:hypothetical protein